MRESPSATVWTPLRLWQIERDYQTCLPCAEIGHWRHVFLPKSKPLNLTRDGVIAKGNRLKCFSAVLTLRQGSLLNFNDWGGGGGRTSHGIILFMMMFSDAMEWFLWTTQKAGSGIDPCSLIPGYSERFWDLTAVANDTEVVSLLAFSSALRRGHVHFVFHAPQKESRSENAPTVPQRSPGD